MDWFNTLISALGGSIVAFIGSIAYFRPRLQQARAESSKAQTEAEVSKFEYYERRIKSMEELYEKQGQILDDVREKMLALGKEMQHKDERITQLEEENKSLTEKVDRLEKEVEQYRNKK